MNYHPMRTLPNFALTFSACLLFCSAAYVQGEPQEAPTESENIASQQLKKLDHVFSPSSTNAEQSLKNDLSDSRIQKAQERMHARQTAALDPTATNSPAKAK